ncbi:MAG TPA: phytoene desaturase [Sphingomonadaceae bacterium]
MDDVPALSGKRACVIGAGFGGLALAIRLQSAGVATTLVEARDKPGGCAYFWERDGFTFDAGPTAIADPAALHELWALSGGHMSDDIELLPISPFYRLTWPDGAAFDYATDERTLRNEIARISPEDIAGYEDFLDFSERAYRDSYVKLGHMPLLDLGSMARAGTALVRQQAWRSIYSMVSSYVRSEKLREAFSFHTLLIGGNPMTASAIYALIDTLERRGGIWWARGGTNRLVAAMVRLFERLGGAVRLHDPVVRIHTIGTVASEVETASGWRERFSAVASNADVMHTYRDLLAGRKRGQDQARALAKKRFSPGAFLVHFGLEGSWPGIPHHTVLFGPRYKGFLEDVYAHGVLPADFPIYLHHPTVTDPSLAPAGKSTFYALVPVAHMGKLLIDWEQIGPLMEKRVLDEVGRRLIPDIHDRIVTKFHYAPRDFALDLNAYLGSAFSIEPTLAQSGFFRAHNRDDVIQNLYLVGAGTHPGAGIPGVIAGAKTTAQLMLEDLSK